MEDRDGIRAYSFTYTAFSVCCMSHRSISRYPLSSPFISAIQQGKIWDPIGPAHYVCCVLAYLSALPSFVYICFRACSCLLWFRLLRERIMYAANFQSGNQHDAHAAGCCTILKSLTLIERILSALPCTIPSLRNRGVCGTNTRSGCYFMSLYFSYCRGIQHIVC